jgi:hypothetical protein
MLAVQLISTIEKIINIYCEQDFGLSVEWHFLATSYGKETAARIRGTVKRLALKKNLQKVYSNQIQLPHELFTYCSSNIHNITFFCPRRANS